MTPFPGPGSPVLFWTAVNAIQVAKVQTMPELEVKKRGRRPMRSTRSGKIEASIQFVIPIIPFNLFWNCGSVIPTSVKILLFWYEHLFEGERGGESGLPQVVSCQTSTRKLREEPTADTNEQTLAISSCSEAHQSSRISLKRLRSTYLCWSDPDIGP